MQRFCARYRIVQTCVFLQRLFFVGLILAAGYLFLDRLFHLKSSYDTLATFVACLGLLALLVYFFLYPRRLKYVGYLVDRGQGLKNLTSSALDVEGKVDPVSRLVYQRALGAVRGESPSLSIPWRLDWSGRMLFVPLLALVVAVLLPQLDLLGRRESEEEKRAERYRVDKASVALQEQAERLHRLGEASSDGPTASMARELDEMAKSLEGLSPEEALERIGSFEESHRYALSQAEDLEKLGRELQAIERNLLEGLPGSSREKMEQLLDSWSQGRLGETALAFRELASLLRSDTLTSMEKAALAEKLRKMAETLRESPLDPKLADLLSQLEASELSSAEALMDAAEFFEELEAMKSLCEGLASAKEDVTGDWMEGFDMEEVERYVETEATLGACCSGAGISGKSGGQGRGQGTGGTGQGTGGSPPEEATDTEFEPEKDPQRLGEGKLLQQISLPSLAEAGEADSEYVKVVEAAKREAAGSLAREQIPAEYEETVKAYFDSLSASSEKGEAP